MHIADTNIHNVAAADSAATSNAKNTSSFATLFARNSFFVFLHRLPSRPLQREWGPDVA